jgi:2-polyprenyl-3-methyl-5-hydroxy-6-metoxy-1,4-benzoquinol methylase
VCGTEGGEPLFEKGRLRVVTCGGCAMLFANPVEAQFIEGQFYNERAAPYYLSPDKLDSDYAPVRFQRELRLFRRYCKRGGVLDIGCSTGAFLFQLGQRYPSDYERLGTDVVEPALRHAESRGVPVLRSSFLEHEFGGRRFDAVTFWAVLEHLNEPRRFLAKAASLLPAGGHCFVLVPNMNSLAVRLLGKRYRYITPEHVNYFTAATFRRMIAREPHFRLIEMRTTHFNPVVIWQDWQRKRDAVPDAERAELLKRTTSWKTRPMLAPVRLAYRAAEGLLGGFRLADNLVAVLQRR